MQGCRYRTAETDSSDHVDSRVDRTLVPYLPDHRHPDRLSGDPRIGSCHCRSYVSAKS